MTDPEEKIEKEDQTPKADHRTVGFNDVDMEIYNAWKDACSEQGMKLQPRFMKLIVKDTKALKAL